MKIKQCLSAFIWLELGKIDKGMNEKYKEKLSKRGKAKLMKINEEENKMKGEKENLDEYEEEYDDDEEEEKEEINKNDDIFEESKEYLDFKEEEEHKMFEEKYKLFLSVFTDENVTLHQDEDMAEEDKDLSIF